MSLKGKNILVTGAGGFIGSHLTENLARKGANVRALIEYNSLGRKDLLDFVDTNTIDIRFGNLMQIESVRDSMNGCDIVFHLGALIAIPYSYQNPRAFFENNVLGSINVFEAARELEIERVVHTSTSEVYGTAQYTPIDEKHPLVGQSPYSASKIGADAAAESFHRSFDVPIVIARPFNNFGPRQSPRAVIPTIIKQALDDGRLTLGNIDTRRDFTYVEDCVDGFLTIAEKGIPGEIYNIGTGEDISIRGVISKIERIIGRSLPVRTNEIKMRPLKSEVYRLQCANDKIKKLGWYPKYSLDEGLLNTVEWFRQNKDFYNVGGNFV